MYRISLRQEHVLRFHLRKRTICQRQRQLGDDFHTDYLASKCFRIEYHDKGGNNNLNNENTLQVKGVTTTVLCTMKQNSVITDTPVI